MNKSTSQRWGEARETELLRAGRMALAAPQPEKEVPTLSEFWPRYMTGHAKANRLKASSLAAEESLFSNHLLPRLGERRLDRITDEDVQDIKAALTTRNRKTVNNVISLLHHTLRIALKWKVIAAMPCTIELYKVSDVAPKFYEVEEYERLVEAAGKIGERTLVAVPWAATRAYVGARSSPCGKRTLTYAGDSYASSCRIGEASSTRPRAAAGESFR